MNSLIDTVVRRGDVVWADLQGATGAEKQKKRPCVVVQNNTGNARSPLTIIVPLTDASAYRSYPQQVLVAEAELWDGAKDSVVDCGHIRSIDKARRVDSSKGVICTLSKETMDKVDAALHATLGMACK